MSTTKTMILLTIVVQSVLSQAQVTVPSSSSILPPEDWKNNKVAVATVVIVLFSVMCFLLCLSAVALLLCFDRAQSDDSVGREKLETGAAGES
ncbi:hypothetical protein QR680_006162 [Steinernema hermaphroditum]|uniref:Uncharacterized protein n=1 Tax=Steinernema hermaphroditum TaxID=289476 RepID=A0AA39HVN4_9BILA|nr:hypothetical protein QR680_006162 [Steinernema hermaphroditum]